MFNVKAAALCLELSSIAYDDDPEPRLLGLGMDLVNRYDVDGTQAFLAERKGILHLSWTGTNEHFDFWRDVAYIKTDFPGGGRVHRGFYDYFDSAAGEIRKDLEGIKGKPLIVDGHSLGGPPALMSAVMFRANVVYTFGSPRAGNEDFVNRISCPVYRFETGFDPVTFVPWGTSPVQAIASWLGRRRVTLYKHAGTQVVLPSRLHTLKHYFKGFRAAKASGELAALEFAGI